jgi:hypothetical protein
VAARVARWPADAAPDGREWAGRVFIVAVFLTFGILISLYTYKTYMRPPVRHIGIPIVGIDPMHPEGSQP